MRKGGKESRKHPRFSVDVEAAVKTSDGRALVARTRDVSRAGICLITSASVPVGQQLSVELVLAFGKTVRSEPLRMHSRVVWCTAIDRAFQVGAMFDELSEDQDAFLEMFLQYLDGTLAPKGVEAPQEETETETEPDPPVPPDIMDDPFRR